MTIQTDSNLFRQYIDSMGIPGDLLQTHLDQLPFHQHSHRDQLLYVAQRHQLDIVSGEITLADYEDGRTHVHISIDGWTQLIHRQEQFCGVQFQEASTLNEGVPEWMMCSIYRKDLVLPITVKEYYQEVKTSERIWQTMPRRMLRHRTLQQCARLAFGLSASEYPFASHTPEAALASNIQHSGTSKQSRTQQLKSVLQDQTMTQSVEDKWLSPSNSTIATADLGPAPSGS